MSQDKKPLSSSEVFQPANDGFWGDIDERFFSEKLPEDYFEFSSTSHLKES
ncbi:predicted protein [Sclerotinia sclerotiorum 1980 UF-70]|uniref:Uncharacterized protein n=2 Tax=Sclerotinia sclerotiorum (strain ATCC 18683 / 1980 / Ss-1) TaxID=665079 RepID=A0A1D9Q2Q9_SCLS1|nr:predicted protein [Sclerotinia sclerotiorum 1980 UF-70]APA09149.1 hypothetical protein sscle_04g039190 [Sclerotinia sclerotiorum 1980 UF-70]EDO00195.1 predicted protein [Sclerotinia sclerotiorum 1980 UF-70]